MRVFIPWLDFTLNAVLTSRIQGGTPPDMAILPNPGKMQELVRVESDDHLYPGSNSA